MQHDNIERYDRELSHLKATIIVFFYYTVDLFMTYNGVKLGHIKDYLQVLKGFSILIQ